MRTGLVIGVILLATSIMARAGNCYYGSYDGEFTNPLRWWDPALSINRVPGVDDKAIFKTDAICTLGAGNTVSILELYLGEWSQSGFPHNSVAQLVINGNLTAKNACSVGCQNEGTPTMRGHMTINESGSFTEEAGILVGVGNNGTITMNGGTLNSTWYISLGCTPWTIDKPGIGTINLNAGTIQTDKLFMGNDSSQITIAEGVLLINTATRIAFYLANAQIVAASGYTLNIDYSYYRGFGARITATRSSLLGDFDDSQSVDLDDVALFAESWLDGTAEMEE